MTASSSGFRHAIHLGLGIITGLFLCNRALAIDLITVDGLVDFDSAVGFSSPKSISVFRSSDPLDHLYFLIPNSVTVPPDANGDPEFGLMYDSHGMRDGGFITFSILPVFNENDVADIIAAVRLMDQDASFGVPQPLSSSFYLVGPDMSLQNLTPDLDTSNPLLSRRSFSTSISGIAVRASLIPASYKYPIFTIGHHFSLRGSARDSEGVTHIVDRKLTISFVIYGVCAVHPEKVINLLTGRAGCGLAHYPHARVREIQRLLNNRGFDAGHVDGVFGPVTESAIRRFQIANTLVVDGIPSDDLARILRSDL